MMYSKAFGSDNNFYRLELDYRQYKSVGHRKVFALSLIHIYAVATARIHNGQSTGTIIGIKIPETRKPS